LQMVIWGRLHPPTPRNDCHNRCCFYGKRRRDAASSSQLCEMIYVAETLLWLVGDMFSLFTAFSLLLRGRWPPPWYFLLF
jgi:hypothetical protein